MTARVVELTVPAREDMLLIARMTLSGVCARCGFGLDMVEDARIAADEACYCLMRQREPVGSLRMTCRWDDARLSIAFESVSAEGGETGYADDPAIDADGVELARSILETLVTSARLSSDGRGVYAIHMEMDYAAGAAAGEPGRGL
ncbi:MAG: hypothetical protein LBS11_07050 [Oscillospiraceae bacterium]|jgi:hypothetical protein|nr:hypothetical protein [Oscillospiraceae bacterium]